MSSGMMPSSSKAAVDIPMGDYRWKKAKRERRGRSKTSRERGTSNEKMEFQASERKKKKPKKKLLLPFAFLFFERFPHLPSFVSLKCHPRTPTTSSATTSRRR